MEILHIAVPAAVLLVIFALIVFWWAVRHGQFDDLERQGMNILLDEEPQKKRNKQQQKRTEKDADTKSNDAEP